MKGLYIYIDKEIDVVKNPNSIQLQDSFDKLDGVQCRNITLVMPSGRLFVRGSKIGRINLKYTDGAYQNAWLLDPTQPSDQYLLFILENGEGEDWALNETVSKDIAIKVAQYFLENDTFPVGYDWEGKITNFG